jgi:hypothetical protein
MPLEKTPTTESPQRFRKLSPAEKDRLLSSVQESLEQNQRERKDKGAYLDSNPPSRPTVEEQRLMSLCRVNSLDDLELAMSSPLSKEWLDRQHPEDRQALEDWYEKLVEKDSQ